jgi:glycosidase
MHFTSNHDENSWNGTEFERMGKGAKTFAALTFVIPGMPLLYNGQEVAFNRRLEFFEKDLIDWKSNVEFTSFYQTLTKLKKGNTTLLAGLNGADLFRVKTSNDVNVFAFTRENETDKIFAVFNLSPLAQSIDITGETFEGEYTDIFSGKKVIFEKGAVVELKPWGFYIYEK